MNNDQFRHLVLDTPTTTRRNGSDAAASANPSGATPSALGSRMRASIPMTPRSVGGITHNDFARQLAERNAELNGSKAKRQRASAAPKGTKLAAGYQDRTKLRTSDEEDDKATRIKALEDMVKLGQMDESTFGQLRDEIVSGDVKNTHLVKGLDYKLLERVKKGEDVLAKSEEGTVQSLKGNEPQPEVDIEEEFEKLEGQHMSTQMKKAEPKKGSMAPPLLVAGKKRTRDDILKDLKAARLAVAAEAKAQKPSLGARFKRVSNDREQSRIEKDEQGRDVLILVDADGNMKRKVRRAKNDEDLRAASGMLMPDKSVAPLGIDIAPQPEPEPSQLQDLDIFEGVGADFNPLGNALGDGDEESDDEEPVADKAAGNPEQSAAMPVAPSHPNDLHRRNYFDEPVDTQESSNQPPNMLSDPTLLAAFKKASKLQASSSAAPEDEEEAAKLAHRKKLLESHDRDAEDMDMGFGSSRFGDEDDAEGGEKVKLSVWGQEEGDKGKRKGETEKRKRGPKKRKGDGENASDVMKALERRKGEKGMK